MLNLIFSKILWGYRLLFHTVCQIFHINLCPFSRTDTVQDYHFRKEVRDVKTSKGCSISEHDIVQGSIIQVVTRVILVSIT